MSEFDFCVVQRMDLVKRLTLARKFKTETCGSKDITPDVFGDQVDYSKHGITINDDHQVAKATTNKIKAGGVIGVYVIHSKNQKRWYAAKAQKGNDKRNRFFDCLIQAVQKRNEFSEEFYPGADAFKCDMQAAIRKYGPCECEKCAKPKRGAK
jgi:hypothetical protein